MGGGKKNSHKSSILAPATVSLVAFPESLSQVKAESLGSLEALQAADAAVVEALAKGGQLAKLTASPHGEDDGGLELAAAMYADLAPLAKSLGEHYATAQESLGDGMAKATASESKKAITGFLKSLPEDELLALAALNGFEHPGLVGINSKTSPLIGWLDPTYPPEALYKQKIQAVANARYAEAQGGTLVVGPGGGWLSQQEIDAQDSTLAAKVGGLPLAAHELEVAALVEDVPDDALTAEQFLDLWKTTLSSTEATLKAGSTWVGLTGLIDEVVTYFDAHGPEGPIDDPFSSVPSTVTSQQVAAIDTLLSKFKIFDSKLEPPGPLELEAFATAAGLDGVKQAAALSLGELVVLGALHKATNKSNELLAKHDELVAFAAKRSVALDLVGGLTPAVDGLWKSAHMQPAFAATDAQAGDKLTALFEWAAAAKTIPGNVLAKKTPWEQAGGWTPTKAGWTNYFAGASTHGSVVNSLGNQWGGKYVKLWTDQYGLTDLKIAAMGAGLPSVKGLTKTQVKDWITGKLFPNGAYAAKAAAVEVAAAAAAAAGHTATPKPKAPSASSPVGTKVPSSGSAPPTVVSKKSFMAKQIDVFNKLKHAVASFAPLKNRPSAAQVATMDFTPTSAKTHQQVGGMATKAFYSDGSGVWMFKPDVKGRSARCVSEAIASELFHKVGLPSVPVYVRQLDGSTGSIQPMLSDTKALEPNPGKWSQADVDAIVRAHVANWVVADHDSKAENYLRTADGGIIPIDHGQAFRFFGQDKLSMDYNPLGSGGSPGPISNVLYHAAQAGQLAAGVKVRPEAALSVIKAFEEIPDPAYRAALAPLVDEGVKQGTGHAHWVPAMRALATARHGVDAPTSQQVKEEFLARALERKNSLRKDFVGFFQELGFESATKLADVA